MTLDIMAKQAEIQALRPKWEPFIEYKPVKHSYEFTIYFDVSDEYEIVTKGGGTQLRLDWELVEDLAESMPVEQMVELMTSVIEQDIAETVSGENPMIGVLSMKRRNND